jgi:ABC-type glutathione transport system ATPase component
VLIVEHDMPLLMGLCDWVYAMDQGRVISEGTPEQVRADPAVIVSYLGTEEAPASPPTRRVRVHQGAGDGRRTPQASVVQEAEDGLAEDDEDDDEPPDLAPEEPTRPLRERPLRARPLRAR